MSNLLSSIELSPTCQIPNLKDIYLNYLNDQGFFVEVGAYDGESFSNTSGLADIGWSGIYIEPIPSYMSICKKRHANNNVIFEECAISNKQEMLEINVVGGLSTVNTTCHNAHKEFFGKEHFNNECKMIVPCFTLNEVLKKNNVNSGFDLLVVDVEGSEPQVFESFDVDFYRPQMIICELGDKHPMFNNYNSIKEDAIRIRKNLNDIGYKQIYNDVINTIFIL